MAVGVPDPRCNQDHCAVLHRSHPTSTAFSSGWSLCPEGETYFCTRMLWLSSSFISLELEWVTRGTVTMDTMTSKCRELPGWSGNDRNSGAWYTHKFSWGLWSSDGRPGSPQKCALCLEKQVSKSSEKGLPNAGGRLNGAYDLFPPQTSPPQSYNNAFY